MHARNQYGQPVDTPIDGWSARPYPAAAPIEGRHCRLEPLDAAQHARALFEAHARAPDGRDWTYLPYGPFADCRDYAAHLHELQAARNQLFFVIDAGDGPMGLAAFMRIAPERGTLEVGHVHYAPALQKRAAATEAMYLMMRRAFDELGYRRYEWKCHALNARSRSAATRLGFTYEGTFRQATVVKGRNRDTAWFSLLDREWPATRRRLEAWLSPDNFDFEGKQRRRLQEVSCA